MTVVPKRNRRFLRFSMRTFLFVVLVICVAMGWKVSGARKQYEAVRWVEKMGGSVVYDYQIGDDGGSIPNAKPPSHRWLFLIELLGLDFFDDVVYVHVGKSSQLSDVTPLAGLTRLEGLNLRGPRVSDVTPLAGLTRLRRLWVMESQVSDVSPLTRLTNLTRLDLHGTQVSDVSPLTRLTNLETLNLGGTQVTDVTPLVGLTNLTRLNLTDIHVSRKEIENLRRALPNCRLRND